MTPAEELRAAATELRETAKRAHYQDDRWFVDVAGPVASTAWLGPSHDVLTATWPQAAWAALMHPKLAEPLAEWLEMEAHMAEKRGLSAEGNTFHALKVARAINGGAQ